MWLSSQTGRTGGSGNGRDTVEDRDVPKMFQELQDAGFLEGPLAQSMNVLNSGVMSASIIFGGNRPEDEDDWQQVGEQVASWGGDDLPDTQEPYGGRTEARELADRKAKGSGGSAGTPRSTNGRPSNIDKLLRRGQEQTNALTDASRDGCRMMAEAISMAMEMQLEETRKQREESRKQREKEYEMEEVRAKRYKEEKESDRKALLEGIAMLAAALKQ